MDENQRTVITKNRLQLIENMVPRIDNLVVQLEAKCVIERQDTEQLQRFTTSFERALRLINVLATTTNGWHHFLVILRENKCTGWADTLVHMYTSI